jgi:hypothetical protein
MKVLMIIGLATATWWFISWAAAAAYMTGIATVFLCAQLLDEPEQLNNYRLTPVGS